MGRLFCLVGKSGSGKDTLYRAILERAQGTLRPVVPWTTRPRRSGEQEGREYHFVTEQTMRQMEEEGRILEQRAYQTMAGTWYYFTADFSLDGGDCLMINTPQGVDRLRRHFGQERVIACYLQVEEGELLRRSLMREERQQTRRYGELCRRFLADQRDFAGFERAGRYLTLDGAQDVYSCVRQFFALRQCLTEE